MAQHDYAIANQDGFSFRTELNVALEAIQTSNSGTNPPSSTQPYLQWYDNTPAGEVLKMRNQANNGWWSIRSKDGDVYLEDGTAAAPGLAFASDVNTGFYRIGADQLGIATNGTAAVAIDASQRVGIGTTPEEILHIKGPSETPEDRDGVMLQHTTAAATADTGLPIVWSGYGSGALTNYTFASICGRKENGSSGDFAGYLQFATGSSGGSVTEKARIDSSGRLLVGTSSSFANADVDDLVIGNNSSATKTGISLGSTDQSGIAFGDASDARAGLIEYTHSLDALRFYTNGAANERMRITNDGSVLIGKTTAGIGNSGIELDASAQDAMFTTYAATPVYVNRTFNDGVLIDFKQDGTTEGSISVSGTTVSYNGAHLSRWSQLPSGAERTEILRGSVLSNIDEMCEWGDEDNEQLNRMKVSDIEGDKNVSGVFQAWDDDDDTYTNDFYCAMTGDFIIRIAEGVTVERGDLLMSAGDGTAKPQDDDIIRSKTIAKVTSTNVSCTYDDGSYCVPCVLMAC